MPGLFPHPLTTSIVAVQDIVTTASSPVNDHFASPLLQIMPHTSQVSLRTCDSTTGCRSGQSHGGSAKAGKGSFNLTVTTPPAIMTTLLDVLTKTLMVINVSQFLQEPVGSTRLVDVSGDEELDAIGEVELIRTDGSILVRGRLSTEVETTCSRCVSPFDCRVSFDIEEEFFPSIDVVSGLPLPEPEDDETFVIDENHILDLHEAVRQYALLSLPIKRLCRTDCPGLCPDCGKNLNDGPCSCIRTTRDARWAKLEQLLPESHAAGEGHESKSRAKRKAAR